MKTTDRNVLRLAGQIRDRLQGLRSTSTASTQDQLSYLLGQTQRLETLHHRLVLCERFHLTLTVPRVLSDLREALTDLPYVVSDTQRSLPEEREPVALSQHDLLRELDQIEEEFGSWAYVQEDKTLSVTTEPIELEEIFLGTFEIKINLEHLGNPRKYPPYSVEALDPHPAACNEHVTHPHVSDDRLCEGDAAAAIRTALSEGRLCDFFLLIRSVLQNYNPESPYVKLEHWSGEPCSDCGHTMSDEGRYLCEQCEESFCENCVSYCRSCDLSVCHGCLNECPACEENVCSNCLKTCRQCHEACCKGCLDDDNLCPTCHEANEEQEKIDDSEQPTVTVAASGQLATAAATQSPAANAEGGLAPDTENGSLDSSASSTDDSDNTGSNSPDDLESDGDGDVNDASSEPARGRRRQSPTGQAA